MKRVCVLVVAVLLAAAFAVPVFAKGAPESTTTTPAKPLVWYMPGGTGFPYNEAEQKAVDDHFNELLQKAIGTTVDIQYPGTFSDYNTKMPLILASGQYMDLFWTATWSNNFLQAVANGYCAGLDDLLAKYGQDILKDTKGQLEAARVDGQIRGVWSEQIAVYNTTIYYQKPLIDKYGFDMSKVKSLPDLEPMLAQIKANEPDLIPFGTQRTGDLFMQPYNGFTSVGTPEGGLLVTKVDDPTDKVFDEIDTPQFKQDAELGWRWNQMGYYPKDGVTYTANQWTNMVNQNKVAFWIHDTYNPQQEGQAVGGVVRGTQPIGQPQVITGNITNTLQAIHANSTQKEMAMKLLDFLWTNKDAYNTLVWGLEGKDYTRLDADHIQPITDSGYFTNVPWMYGNTFISYLMPGQTPALVDKVKQLNDSARKAQIMGFNPNVDDVKTLAASIKAVTDQYAYSVGNGYVDPATGIPQYQAAVKKAGIDEMIAKVQVQIDAWKKANGK